MQKIDGVVNSLLAVKTDRNLRVLLKEYTFGASSLQLYTRLMVNLEVIADKLSTSRTFKGQLYELAVKTALIGKDEFYCVFSSYKYLDPITAKGIDLYVPGQWNKSPLLFEATITHKEDESHNVTKFLKEREIIRVVTDLPDVWEQNETYYRIGYPKALLMLSNDSIFGLWPSIVVD